MNAKCVKCDKGFNPKRKDLGYSTCLDCGDKDATIQTLRKSRCTAPAYNKGAYMYVTNAGMAKDIGR